MRPVVSLSTLAASAFLAVVGAVEPQELKVDNDRVAQVLEKLGAKIERDEKHPARPIVSVDL